MDKFDEKALELAASTMQAELIAQALRDVDREAREEVAGSEDTDALERARAAIEREEGR